MTKYYYNKYNTISTTTYSESPNWIEPTYELGLLSLLYNSYKFNKTTNTFSGYGGRVGSDATLPAGADLYTTDTKGELVERCTLTEGGNTSRRLWYRSTMKYASDSKKSISYSQGSLVQSNISAEDGTYPNNGRHTDGYWYVKGLPSFPELKLEVDGSLKTSDNGWLKVDGMLHEIDNIIIKLDGVLKEV